MFGTKVASVVGAATMLAGLGLGLTTTSTQSAQAAESASTVTTQPITTDASVAASCFVTPKPRVGAVFIRSAPRETSRRVAQVNHGQQAAAACVPRQGGWYKAAGCTSGNWWVHATRQGHSGWVALGCVRWYRR